jgi:hypothetical protein
MYIDNLILEATRKCNLRCAHCLRGNPQRVTMSREVLHATMSHVDHIGSLLFTGGEPSLASEVIEDFIDICIWRKVSFGSFYVITNGKAHNGLSRFMEACNRLYAFADEQPACGVIVSQDQYHKALRDIQWHRYELKDEETGKSYGEFPPFFDAKSRDHSIDFAFDMGRAHENQLGYKPPHEQMPWTLCEEANGSLHVFDNNGDGPVYISANGNVVSSCDQSFRVIDKESKGNVLITPLPEILKSFCTPEERMATA